MAVYMVVVKNGQRVWEYLARLRSHHNSIRSLLFGVHLDSNEPRLLSLGKDRFLVRHSVQFADPLAPAPSCLFHPHHLMQTPPAACWENGYGEASQTSPCWHLRSDGSHGSCPEAEVGRGRVCPTQDRRSSRLHSPASTGKADTNTSSASRGQGATVTYVGTQQEGGWGRHS